MNLKMLNVKDLYNSNAMFFCLLNTLRNSLINK